MSSKFNMTMVALAFAAMLKKFGVASNSLWPQTVIDTDALKKLVPLFPDIVERSRSPKSIADVAGTPDDQMYAD